jgi:hypothetical protein
MRGMSTRANVALMYARTAGILGLISLVAGGFGEAYVPAVVVVAGDPPATAANITASASLFRLGFAAYLVEGLCDTGLTLLFYVLLRAVRYDLAVLAVLFRLIATAGFAMSQVLHFAALPIATATDRLQALPPGQVEALAMLSIQVSAHGQTVFGMFYGCGSIVLGYLMYRSRLLPRFIGILVALGGFGFVGRTFTWVLAPAYSTPVLLIPGGVAALILTVWLVARGVDTVGLDPPQLTLPGDASEAGNKL